MKKLFLLDAMALIYRAYYAMNKTPRITSKGLNTSAILGFTNTLYEVLRTEKPTHIAVSFDTGAPTVRHADFEAYKAHRQETPEDIISSIPYIKKIVDAFNIPIIIMDGYEADDIIGTIAKKAELEGFKVYMMTSDKDYGQLVSENIFMYKPAKFGQKAEVVGVKEICEKYGIQNPEQLIDILGLWGDASDNIPGVPGIGEVKAKNLIAEFGSIENIYKKIDQVKNAKLKETLIENQDQALMSKMLATIILDVPIEYDFEKMKYNGPNPEKLKEAFNELEFRALSQRVFKDLALGNHASASSKPANNGVIDLFSTIDNPEGVETFSSFDTFRKQEHHFQEINSEESWEKISSNFSNQTIFFEWITSTNKITGFSFSLEKNPVYYHFLEENQSFYTMILKTIFHNENQIITYQCKQTYKFLKIFPFEITAKFFDLQIAHYLIQPENSHALDWLSEVYLNYALLKENNPSAKEHAIDIACEKIEVYRKLYPIFKEELEKTNTFALFSDIEMPLSKVLAEMEYNGITVDKKILQQNSALLNRDIENLETKIFELAGVKFNLASPKQLGEVLFEKLKIIDNAKLTKTKQYQTGEEILVKLASKHSIIPLILEYRTLSKLKSTYIDALPALINEKTGKIHTTFNQTVTSTGRLSSVNPNLQNIPIRTERGKDIRKAFVPSDPDAVILSADYSQIELRIVASICEDRSMIDSFIHNIDIHTTTAAKVFNVPLTEVTPDMRRKAKTVNFGILYGISSFGLAERLHIPPKEANDLIREYFHNFPKINEYLDSTIDFARKNGYVETLFGRRRYIRDISSGNAVVRKAAERNAINAPIQGTAADLIKIAMIRISQRIEQQKLNSKMLLQVHDELVFEVPKTEIDAMKQLVAKEMENAMQLAVPLAIEINYGNSWYEAH